MAEIEIKIENEGVIYAPLITEEVTWSLERQGAPGKLEFTVVKDEIINFQEGNSVKMYVDGKPVFYGFVFEKTRSKENTIKVLAYDQMRYLKNKDTIKLEGESAAQFIKNTAADFNLTCGDIAETVYVPEARYFDGDTIFDMFQTLLDETLVATGKLYVLYDDFGKLTLKALNDMNVEILLDEESIGDFDYSTSIDKETYNKVKLLYSDDRKGAREVKTAESAENIKKWGVLQYYEKADDALGMQEKALRLLNRYNSKTRSLSLKDCFGNISVRGGSRISVALNLGDIVVNKYFLCERVSHSFKGGVHLMNIDLRGSDFIV